MFNGRIGIRACPLCNKNDKQECLSYQAVKYFSILNAEHAKKYAKGAERRKKSGGTHILVCRLLIIIDRQVPKSGKCQTPARCPTLNLPFLRPAIFPSTFRCLKSNILAIVPIFEVFFGFTERIGLLAESIRCFSKCVVRYRKSIVRC